MNPTQGDVHVDTALGNISVAYMQDDANFVAERVFPSVPVQKQSDRYFVYSKDDLMRDDMEERAPGDEARVQEFSLDNTPNYFCREYARASDIPDSQRANADEAVADLDMSHTRIASRKALMLKERVFTANFFTTGIWTDVTGVASGANNTSTFLQFDAAASNPMTTIDLLCVQQAEFTGYKPNVIVAGPRVFLQLKNNPNVIERIKYQGQPSNPAAITTQALAALFGVDEFLVPYSTRNTGKKGKTTSTADYNMFFGKGLLLCYRAPAPGLMVPSAGYTFPWVGRFGASALGTRIKSYYIDTRESTRIEAQMAFDMKVISPDLGIYIDQAVG